MTTNNPMKLPHVRSKVKNTAVGSLEDGTKVRVDLSDPRWRTGELVHINKGKITVKDIDGKIFHVSKEDSRWETGEISHITKGRERTPQQIELHRDKMKGRKWSSEMRSKRAGQPAWNKGMKTGPLSEETKLKQSLASRGRKKPTISCPHCNKIGGVSPMNRWHFDNCKEKS
jgi:hypothetical protein